MLRQLILEKYDNLSMKQKKRIINLAIDIAVAMYQENHSEEDFALICDLLPPNSHFLKNKYAFLCDEYADFDAEYLFCFVKACNEYGKNKKKMTSNFQSYFFSTVNHHFINKIVQATCTKRNPKLQCPICSKSAAPLNTHVLKDHPELVESMLWEQGHNIKTLTKCPYCQHPLTSGIVKHIEAKHSSLIFSYFQERYPLYSMSIINPAPPLGLIYNNDEQTGSLEEVNAKPMINNMSNDNSLTLLSNLTECQQTVVYSFSSQGATKIPQKKKICELCHQQRNSSVCPRGDGFKLSNNIYKREIDDLGDKLNI
jgi:hypothetical protein